MLKKIVAIKNVGRFRNSASAGDQHLAKHTFIVAANGYGKSTICAILRSLQTEDSTHISGRKILGVDGKTSIELLFDTGPIRFDGTSWNNARPNISIFDNMFIAENIYAGESVSLDHKRNLHKIIVGSVGVKLAEADATLASASRGKTGDISSAARSIATHVPTGMALEDFLILPNLADIDEQIADQEKMIDSIRNIDTLKKTPDFQCVTYPVIPNNLVSTLAFTIEQVSDEAERLTTIHLKAHQHITQDWISRGIAHASDVCPLCGQDLASVEIIKAFRAIFSEQYKKLAADVKKLRLEVEGAFSDALAIQLQSIADDNRGRLVFWSRFVSFGEVLLELPGNVADTIKGVREEALAMILRKEERLLDPVLVTEDFVLSLQAFMCLAKQLEDINASLKSANILIANKKAATGTVSLKSAQLEMARRTALRVRHTPAVGALCSDYFGFVEDKDTLDKERRVVRDKLNSHSEAVIEPHERLINSYLDAFNAGFYIAGTAHGYPGGAAASTYDLVINDTSVGLGDGKTSIAKPSFKNTLSGGDKTTLALAFFLGFRDKVSP